MTALTVFTTPGSALGSSPYLQAVRCGSCWRFPADPDRHDRRLSASGTTTRGSDPSALPPRQLSRRVGPMGTWHTYLQNLPVRGHRLGDNAVDRFQGRLFPGLPYPLDHCGGWSVPGLHDPVPDHQRDPHDLVDSAFWAATGCVNPVLMHLGIIDRPLEFLLFSPFRGGAWPSSTSIPVHGRADLQFDDAHRPSADRGGRTPAPKAGRSCAT